MKTLRFILLLLLSAFCVPHSAFGQWHDFTGLSAITAPAAISATNPPSGVGGLTNVLGLSDIAASGDTWPADATLSYRVQATASGSLSKAFVYVNNSDAAVVKVALYGPDTDSTWGSEDAQIGVSGTITANGSAGWQPSSGESITGTVTSGSYYWIVVFISSTSPTLGVRTSNSQTVVYKAGSGFFASPPANLSTANSGGTFGPISAYITMTP